MNKYSVGSMINNRFEVISKPLMGGMGIVYPCLDIPNDALVALKTLKSEFLPDLASRDLFLREGTAWLDLETNANIVRCLGVEHVNTGNEVYLVLDYVTKEDGYNDASLRSWLKPGKPLPIDCSLLFALQIARGMSYASTQINGFVHRDLKPENLLISKDKLPGTNTNRLRVTDFGLSSLTGKSISRQTQIINPSGNYTSSPMIENRTQLSNGMVGTPYYMAPEQWLGETISTATDIYALGCILYEMLAGRMLVNGESIDDIAQRHCTRRYGPIPANLAEDLTTIIKKCLASNPGKRYQNWQQVILALTEAYKYLTGKTAPVFETAKDLTQSEQIALGWGYGVLGSSYLDIGKVDIAFSYFKRMQLIAKIYLSVELESGALNNLGTVFLERNELQQAIDYYENSLKLKRKIGNEIGLVTSLGGLGIVYAKMKDFTNSMRCLNEALLLSRKADNIYFESQTLGNLGYVAIKKNEINDALSYLKQALDINRATSDIAGIATNLYNLAKVYAKLGDIENALLLAKEAKDTYTSCGDPKAKNAQEQLNDFWILKSMKLINEGVTKGDSGDIDNAILCYEKALEISAALNHGETQIKALDNLGFIYTKKGNTKQALKCFDKGRTIAQESGDQEFFIMNSFYLAGLQTGLDGFFRALSLLNEAHKIGKEINSPALQNIREMQGGIFNNLGEYYRENDEFQKALEYYKEALLIWHEINFRQGEGIALGNLALVEYLIGDNESSHTYFDLAFDAYEESGDLETKGSALFNLALLHQQERNIHLAMICALECQQIFKSLGNSDNQRIIELIMELKVDEKKSHKTISWENIWHKRK